MSMTTTKRDEAETPAEARKRKAAAEARFHASIREARKRFAEAMKPLIRAANERLRDEEAEALAKFYEETEGLWPERTGEGRE